ncbi:MAG: VanZ family protein [Lachnospiraceae bacterium]|nr:VanZ family protein [Lachnospiraceae bacterium]
MSGLITGISLAMNHFIVYAGLFTIPFVLFQIGKKKLNFVRLGVNYVFLLYILCVIGLVFFPVPGMTGAGVKEYFRVQPVPFQFIKDILRETPFIWNQPRTYLSAITDWAVLQVVFNVAMFVPLGLYLRFNFHFTGKKVVVISFLFSCFIEIGQLTGLFFLFPGAYRLGDVDDLMINTLGGLIGYGIMKWIEKKAEEEQIMELFDIRIEKKKTAEA